jgi:hypothetical protein
MFDYGQADVKLSRNQLGCTLIVLTMCAFYYLVVYIILPIGVR